MAPSLAARQDLRAPVSPSCCAVVHRLGRSPRCLCAVMLSNTAKSVGIKPQVAMTIPKHCNLADRPVGYKCGGGYFSSHHECLVILYLEEHRGDEKQRWQPDGYGI
ncbi:hypothetical protein ACMD2_15025 [Ananas comosus]|uniref:Bifunctional inhibitor/plant lipid transfer protein/seed storage helical domain-containing protein n=1 Tax=Ananas comosus TaxID=4615 RepID=A0A199UG24_ANACO|nr:hypothetical protein ACMD2_15025 [Ananas comosus]